jgi:hypothetical protein
LQKNNQSEVWVNHSSLGFFRITLSSVLISAFLLVAPPAHADLAFADGQITLDSALVSGQTTTLEPSTGDGITGFDPATTLRLSLTLSAGGTFLLENQSKCPETNVPVALMDFSPSTSHDVALAGTQKELNCYLGSISVKSNVGSVLKAGVIEASSSFNPITKKLYSVVNAPGLNWQDAKTAAANNTKKDLEDDIAGYLGTINSHTDNLVVGKAIANGTFQDPEHVDIWFGLTDFETEGDWKWVEHVDGTPYETSLDYTNWRDGEGGENALQNFGFIGGPGSAERLWMDEENFANPWITAYLAEWSLPNYVDENWASTQVTASTSIKPAAIIMDSWINDEIIEWYLPEGVTADATYDVLVGADELSLLPLTDSWNDTVSTGLVFGLGEVGFFTNFDEDLANLPGSVGQGYVVRIITHWATGETSVATKRINGHDVCPASEDCGEYDDSSEMYWRNIHGAIQDAKTEQGNGDAYDDGLVVKIGSTYASATALNCELSTVSKHIESSIPGTTVIPGTSIVCDSQEVVGLSVTLSRYFYSQSMWTRTMVSIINDSNLRYEGHIWLESELGSDGETTYEATSDDSQGTYTTEDSWVVTGDNGEDGDPVIVHMLGNDIESVSTADNVNKDGESKFVTQYALVLNQGNTTSRAWFDGLAGYAGSGYAGAVTNGIKAAEEFAEKFPPSAPTWMNMSNWTYVAPIFSPPDLGIGASPRAILKEKNLQLTASWPTESKYDHYEYQISDNDGDTWTDGETAGETVPVANSGEPIQEVPIGLTPRFANYMLQVRGVISGDPSGDPADSYGPWMNSGNYYFGLQGCTSLTARVNVLMVSVPSDASVNGTNPETIDTKVMNELCSSAVLNVSVFNGTSDSSMDYDSPYSWIAALAGIDVLVLPELYDTDRDTSFLSGISMDVLRYFVESGGRLVFTSGASYADEFEQLLGLENGTLDVEAPGWDTGTASYAVDWDMPDELASHDMSNFDEDTWSAINISSGPWQYQAMYAMGDDDAEYGVGQGQVFQVTGRNASKNIYGSIYVLANNFAESDADWGVVLRQTVYGSIEEEPSVMEAGTSWGIEYGGLEGDSESTNQFVRIGSAMEPHTVVCASTPTNPLTITRNVSGTTATCGKVKIDDGTSIDVTLTRFFAASAPWVATSVNIKTGPGGWSDEAWFGGTPDLGDSPIVEVDGEQDLGGEASGNSSILMASSGESISNYVDDEDERGMVVIASGQDDSWNYGGAGLSGSEMNRKQLWSSSYFGINAKGSKTLTWFYSRLHYQTGCDRLASKNAWDLTNQFIEDAKDEEGNLKSFSDLDFPNLEDIDCVALEEEIENLQQSSGPGTVDLSWDKVDRATKYKISYRLENSNNWSVGIEVPTSESNEHTYSFQGLDAATYEFKIQPIMETQNSIHGFTSGYWTYGQSISVETVSSPTTPPTTPPPSSTVQTGASSDSNVTNLSSSLASVVKVEAQLRPVLPVSIKSGRSLKFAMQSASGIRIRVTSIGACKTTSVYRTKLTSTLVGNRLRFKRTKIQTGWNVKATRKGVCTITFSNPGDKINSPLAEAVALRIY